jgi:hypothetical protein
MIQCNLCLNFGTCDCDMDDLQSQLARQEIRESPGAALGLSYSMLQRNPELLACTSAHAASKVLFGVKTLTHLVGIDAADRDRVVAFFGSNHSDLVAWASHAKARYNIDFYAVPEHRKVYQAMIKALGLPTAVRLTQSRDFADIATGWQFVNADKRRLARFRRDIMAALKQFPAAAHAVMIHDYFVEAMKRAERPARTRTPRPKAVPIPEVTLPVPELPEIQAEGFKILVPKDAADLRKIGNAQNHCVGTAGMGYANKILKDQVWIFAVYRENLSDGVCVEVAQGGWADMDPGEILQAQGRLRREPTAAEMAVIQTVVKHLVNLNG